MNYDDFINYIQSKGYSTDHLEDNLIDFGFIEFLSVNSDEFIKEHIDLVIEYYGA